MCKLFSRRRKQAQQAAPEAVQVTLQDSEPMTYDELFDRYWRQNAMIAEYEDDVRKLRDCVARLEQQVVVLRIRQRLQDGQPDPEQEQEQEQEQEDIWYEPRL